MHGCKVRLIATIAGTIALSAAIATPIARAQNAAAAQTSKVAEQAYIYGFPMVDLYRIMYGYFVDPKNPAYKAPFNTLYNTANVYTPADTTIQTPNSDTPYSYVGLDLRAEPVALTLPPIQSNRYYSVQFVDEYTFNIAYVGTRTTGNGGGTFLAVGPGWHGAVPSGIKKVIRFDTDFGLAFIRTQLFGPSDLANVKKIQAGYAAQTLSSYAHTAAPAAAPKVSWLPALTPAEERSSPTQFFNLLAYILQFCPMRSSEVALRQSFASIGISPAKPFNSGSQKAAYLAGMTAGQKAIDVARAAATSSAGFFGTPEEMKNNYLTRAMAAQYGILGNTATEALYLVWTHTSGGPLVGTNKYTVHYAKGELPPANAFWSMTMYDLPQQLLVANPINRYLINSPMLPTLKRDPDGGITLYVQNGSPGKDKASNWLPTPTGHFFVILRIYWPKASALSGQWKQPPMNLAE